MLSSQRYIREVQTGEISVMGRKEVTQVVVACVKYGQELPALDRPPFGGELGERIFENVSKPAWDLWQSQSTILINHYGLNMADGRSHEFLMKQLEEFFFGEGAEVPEGWVPEGQGTPGGGAPSGGAASKK